MGTANGDGAQGVDQLGMRTGHHGDTVGPFTQLRAFARIRAVEVFPIPRGPTKR